MDIIKELIFRNRDRHANPVFDGPMRPNSKLEACPVLCDTVAEPDDLAFSSAGAAYVTSGRKLMRFDNADFRGGTLAAEFSGLATGVAAHPAGGVIVAVAGEGIAFVDGPQDGKVLRIESAGGLTCPTALVAGPLGEIYLCEGSRDNPPERWHYDLMEKRHTGRVLRIDPGTGDAMVIADAMRFPNGVCLAKGGGSLIVSEAWSHNLLRLPMNAQLPHWARPEAVMRNLPGYPARIDVLPSGYCLTLFALRTQLVDFVLTEDSYRRKMIERIDPAFWIVPALRSEGHYLEPVQGGGLKKHGSLKAWAPPRSYGIVVFLDEEFGPESSLHSRVGGTCHGITGVAVHHGAVYVTSKGHGKIILASGGQVQ